MDSTDDDQTLPRLLFENQAARDIIIALADMLAKHIEKAPPQFHEDYIDDIAVRLEVTRETKSLRGLSTSNPESKAWTTMKRAAFEDISAEFMQRLRSSFPSVRRPDDTE